MDFSRADLKKARDWVYRSVRPVDLARWRYHFEVADNAAVLEALAAYQKEDGGFGHGWRRNPGILSHRRFRSGVRRKSCGRSE